MRKIKVKYWENGMDECVLFAIQRLDEILFFYTKDTYKARIFNTKLLMEEYIETNQKIDDGLLEKKNDEKVFDELMWALHDDNEAIELIGREMVKNFQDNMGSMSRKDKVRGISCFLKALSGEQYFFKIKEELYKAIQDGSKKEIDRLLIAFVCEAKNIGYEARYIYKALNLFFIKSEVVSENTFKEFLDLFDGVEKEYSQLIEVDKELAQLCVKMANVFNNISIIIVDEIDLPKNIKKMEGNAVFVEVNGIKALDEYSALEMANAMLKIIGHFYSFYRNKVQKSLIRGFVKVEGSYHYIRPEIKGVNRSAKVLNLNNSVEGTKNLFDSVLVNPYNFYLLTRVMDIHNIAIGVESDSNALLDLWSVLELLLEKENEDSGKSRVVQINDMIMPFIRNTYVEGLIKTLNEDFRRWDKKVYQHVVQNVDEGSSNLEKMFVFITLEKYDELRKKVYARLEEYPLMRYRLFCLNENLKSAKKIKQILDMHERKVMWQIYRIYRARNCIIHDGENISKIDELVENLHYYIDIMCEGIIKTIGNKSENFTVADAIYEMKMKESVFKTYLNEKITEENCIRYLIH